jgi:hypothetical protein
MNRILPILVFVSTLCNAQDYQCLQSGVTHFFTNDNGYLRGIRIDSVRTMSSDTTVYYPFHTPRGSYDIYGFPVSPVDSNGGCWLGKRVLQRNDGTFIFDNYWTDSSTIIKTNANVGDSWIFHRDTGRVFYTATVTANDTMTFPGILDSVKTIRINARNASGIVTSDSLNGFTIKLSKNNGFVQVFDLYTFPYRLPDSVYTPGIDFFLDESLCTSSGAQLGPIHTGDIPTSANSIFKLVNFINPTEQQLYDWHIGDIVESYHFFTDCPIVLPGCAGSSSVTYEVYLSDTVTSRVASGHTLTLSLNGTHDPYPCGFDPCDLICNSGIRVLSDNVYPLDDSSYMPEEKFPASRYYWPYILYYFPYDNSRCRLSPLYVPAEIFVHPDDHPLPVYKLGIGMLSNNNSMVGDNIWEWNNLRYTNIGGVPCGTPIGPMAVSKPDVPASISIFPNPVKDELIVKAPMNITSLAITNLLGKTVYTSNNSAAQAVIDVSSLPAGIYLIKVNGTEVRRFVKE